MDLETNYVFEIVVRKWKIPLKRGMSINWSTSTTVLFSQTVIFASHFSDVRACDESGLRVPQHVLL